MKSKQTRAWVAMIITVWKKRRMQKRKMVARRRKKKTVAAEDRRRVHVAPRLSLGPTTKSFPYLPTLPSSFSPTPTGSPLLQFNFLFLSLLSPCPLLTIPSNPYYLNSSTNTISFFFPFFMFILQILFFSLLDTVTVLSPFLCTALFLSFFLLTLSTLKTTTTTTTTTRIPLRIKLPQILLPGCTGLRQLNQTKTK